MRLYIADRVVRNRVSLTYFFRMAYMWKFKKDTDVSQDVRAYMEDVDPPLYVREYVTHIQQTEAGHAVQTL